MKLDKNTKILIIGLGVIGGGYASALTEKRLHRLLYHKGTEGY
jgi:prephenate dehydrogenase